MISISMVVSVIITIIIAGLIWSALWWLVGYCELKEPFNKAARIALAILGVLFLIGLLLSFVGEQPVFRP